MDKWVPGKLQGCGGFKRGVTWSDGRDSRADCLPTVATSVCTHHHDAAFVDRPACSQDHYNERLSTLCKAQKTRYAESQRSKHADTELDEEDTSKVLPICGEGEG